MHERLEMDFFQHQNKPNISTMRIVVLITFTQWYLEIPLTPLTNPSGLHLLSRWQLIHPLTCCTIVLKIQQIVTYIKKTLWNHTILVPLAPTCLALYLIFSIGPSVVTRGIHLSDNAFKFLSGISPCVFSHPPLVPLASSASVNT